MSQAATGSGESASPVLDRVALKMASSLDLEGVLSAITHGMVEEVGAAFVRIWLLGPGDLCGECHNAAACQDRRRCLHLRASAGISTNLNGEYRRVPLGGLKIGRIAQGWGPTSTNDVLTDDRLPGKDWLRANKLRAFAGYPLECRDELLGVLALFSRRPLTAHELDRLPIFASQAAVAVKTAQLFAETNRLKNRYRADARYLQEELKERYDETEILGESPSFRKVIDCIKQVAPTNATVLLEGETGTGKELLARAIHGFSRRRDRPLVKVNCAAVPASLIESEFFGHEKGAFTGATNRRIGRFELADGGTIFLDEIGELPFELQSKLLRVLQEHEFERVGGSRTLKADVRVVAATNRNLLEATRDNTFRSDLYYRLSVFPVRVPPLRDRPEVFHAWPGTSCENLRLTPVGPSTRSPRHRSRDCKPTRGGGATHTRRHPAATHPLGTAVDGLGCPGGHRRREDPGPETEHVAQPDATPWYRPGRFHRPASSQRVVSSATSLGRDIA